MNKKTFDREIAVCRKLYKKDKGCKWGKCFDCGTIPLLYKLYKGKILENKKEIKKLKNKIFN
ncbi:MAG: hypothetical protein AAB487_03605 [Patescibacteria group bacterium]